MSDQTKTRFAVDLDDLERQLRQTAGTQPKAKSGDPLADLARIVGQDDPFKSLFAERRGPAQPLPASSVSTRMEEPMVRRTEPAFEPRVTRSDLPAQMPSDPAAALPAQDMLDEFDRLLQSELRGTTAPVDALLPESHDAIGLRDTSRFVDGGKAYDGFTDANPAPKTHGDDLADLDQLGRQLRADENLPRDVPPASPEHDYPEPPAEQPADLRSLEPTQPRKGLVIALVLLGVAALGVGGVIGIRSLSGPVSKSSDPPLILAETGPSKVQPQNPGGVEIPNQNRQIYERTPEPKAGEARVVTREEQPIDVQATARAASRVILPGPGAAAPQVVAATPVAAVPAVPVEAAPSSMQPASALGEPRRVRTIAVRPDGTIAPVNGAQSPAPPTVTTATPRPAAPAVIASAPQPRPPAAPRVVASDEAPAPRPAPQRTQVAAAPAVSAAPRTTEPEAGGGGFMVQLGAPGSEAEARSTFASLQRRFGDQLSGDTPVIRRADVNNGRTVYRLRVGPFSREQATEKCQALQASGGQCFIARN